MWLEITALSLSWLPWATAQPALPCTLQALRIFPSPPPSSSLFQWVFFTKKAQYEAFPVRDNTHFTHAFSEAKNQYHQVSTSQKNLKKIRISQALVAHACNPSYSRRQRLRGLQFEASPGKQFARLYLEKPYHKKIGLVEWLKVKTPSSSPSTTKKTRLNQNNLEGPAF
jgi:hypothetical protein